MADQDSISVVVAKEVISKLAEKEQQWKTEVTENDEKWADIMKMRIAHKKRKYDALIVEKEQFEDKIIAAREVAHIARSKAEDIFEEAKQLDPSIDWDDHTGELNDW